MRFTILTRQQRAVKRESERLKWRLWFAWRPVRLFNMEGHRTEEVAWLEYVARRRNTYLHAWGLWHGWMCGPKVWVLQQPAIKIPDPEWD